jgi:hypothetical protein
MQLKPIDFLANTHYMHERNRTVAQCVLWLEKEWKKKIMLAGNALFSKTQSHWLQLTNQQRVV